MHYLVLAKASETPKEFPQLFHPLVLALASENDVVLAVNVGLEDVGGTFVKGSILFYQGRRFPKLHFLYYIQKCIEYYIVQIRKNTK